jgi:hypothetical protein
VNCRAGEGNGTYWTYQAIDNCINYGHGCPLSIHYVNLLCGCLFLCYSLFSKYFFKIDSQIELVINY